MRRPRMGLQSRFFAAILLLLALPIPLTNYLFGGIILVFALALLERDGALMLGAWGLGLAALATTGALSGGLVAALQPVLGRFL